MSRRMETNRTANCMAVAQPRRIVASQKVTCRLGECVSGLGTFILHLAQAQRKISYPNRTRNTKVDTDHMKGVRSRTSVLARGIWLLPKPTSGQTASPEYPPHWPMAESLNMNCW